jgi:hypothetical protein
MVIYSRIFCSLLFILSLCISCLSQNKGKDTALIWLDDIDVVLLNSQGSKISAIPITMSDKYTISESQNNSAISNAQNQINEADSRMTQYSGKAGGSENYNKAAEDKYNAQSAKDHAEWNKQSDERMANAYNISMQSIKEWEKARVAAVNKEIETARNDYQWGKWAECVTNYESAFKLTGGMYSANAAITSSDWCLLARAGKRAIENKNTLNMKQSPYEWNFTAYTNTLSEIKKTTLNPFQQSELIDEIINWYPKMLNNLPESSRMKYSKWFFDMFYSYLSANEGLIRLSRFPELIQGISKCEIESGDKKIYNDFIYALEHEGELLYLGHGNEIKTDWHIPKTNSGQGFSLSTDALFLNAAYYQELSGNKEQALDIWQSYLDYADFSIQHKAFALYYGLALERTEKLKKEVGTNAINHVNHNWGIKKNELEKKADDKKKDAQRTKSGLDWDSDK